MKIEQSPLIYLYSHHGCHIVSLLLAMVLVTLLTTDTYSGHVNMVVLFKDCFHHPQCISANKNVSKLNSCYTFKLRSHYKD